MRTIILTTILVLLVVGPLAWWAIGRPVVRRSTRDLIKAYGIWPFFSLSGLHVYVYGRWPRRYVRFLVRHVLSRLGPHSRRWAADQYHGKVLTPQHARSIITLDRPIALCDLDQVIPYPKARQLVLNGPPEIVLFDCPCREAREDPCHPLRVCMVIGNPFADFILEHHREKSHRATPREALAVLEAEHQRGHVHSAWFKDVCLDRFFAICNCCSCCCGGIEAMVRYGVPAMASSGYVADVDESLCQACGTCRSACAFHAIQMNGTARVDRDLCLGCGVCETQCPHHAVLLKRDSGKGIPLDVRLLGDPNA